MKINKRSFIAISASLLFVFAIAFLSCKKDRLPAQNTGGNYASASSFYTQYQQPEQVFQIDSVPGGPLFGHMGTQLFPDKNIFMYPNGSNFTYPYTIKLIEIYPGKDMILSSMPSVAGTGILETGGEIRVRAFKGTTELVLRPGKKFHMQLDTNASLLSGMSMYYGFPNGSITDWTNNLTSLDPTISPDTLSSVVNTPYLYSVNIGRMGWVNCARAYSNSSTTSTLSFTSTGTNTQNIDIFLVFSSIHSVMKVYNMQSYPIPNGSQVTMVAMARDANQNNSMVYDKQIITVNGNQQITLNMQSITDANLLNILSTFH